MKKMKMQDLYVGLVVVKDGVHLRCLDPYGYTATFEVCEVDKRGNIVQKRKFVRLTEKELVFDF